MMRTNIIRESDEILGDRILEARVTSISTSSSERNDPIFRDFRKERLGHYPELVRHRIQSKRHQHEQLRKRLRDQGMMHNLTQREIRHLDLNQKYVSRAHLSGNENSSLSHPNTLLKTQNITFSHKYHVQIHRRC